MNPDHFLHSPAGRVIKTETGFYAFVPHPLPPDLRFTPDLINLLSEADRALGQLAGLGNSLLNPHLLILPFSRREAVLSSRIEGTQTSLSDLYAYEAVQLQLPLFESPPDVREVYNYVKALNYGLERLGTLPISLRLIREIHAELMADVRGEHQTPGEFRRSPNWIGPPSSDLNTAPFVPPPVPEMKKALDAFEKFLHASSPLPPLIRLGLVHYQFEAIHPFLDGNGRVGRLLIILLLVAWNLLPSPLLYLSVYFEANRQAYYDLLLKVSQQGVWEEWLSFFLQGVASQSYDAVRRAKRLQTLREQYREQVQTEQVRAAAGLLQVVDFLFVRPVLTVRQVETDLSIDYQKANRYVKQLAQMGLLREMTGQARNRIFLAETILRTIDDPLPPDPEGSE
jgi:Fic family protein